MLAGSAVVAGREERTKHSVAVVGAGNSARALAAYLAQQGHSVSLLARNLSKIPDIATSKTVKATGCVEGHFKLLSVTNDEQMLLPQVEIVFVATVADAYEDVAKQLGPHLKSDHTVILFSGKLGGTLAFIQALKTAGDACPIVLETDALFACRAQEDESVWIRGFKQWTLFSGINKNVSLDNSDLIADFFPGLEPAKNLIERGLTDFGALAHAAIVLANMNTVDRSEPFLFYYEGLTERTVKIAEELEAEFSLIAAAYGASLVPMKDLLNRYYGCDSSSLLTAMRTVPNYRHSQSPLSLEHRFLTEDVACTLIPAREFAELAGIRTPVIDAVITFASILTGRDFREKGRTLAKLGLDGTDYRSLKDMLNS